MPYAQKMSGIYGIRSATSGRQYIGSSSSILKRWSEHRHFLRRGNHPNIYLQRAWDKYGENDFEFVVLEECSVELLFEREQYYFEQVHDKYNLAPVAKSSLGVTRSPETCAKISASKMGNSCALGHTLSHETKQRIGEANRGRKLSPETKAKMSTAKKGNKYSLGHSPTDETRAKLSAAAKAQWERKRAERLVEADGAQTTSSSKVDSQTKSASS